MSQSFHFVDTCLAKFKKDMREKEVYATLNDLTWEYYKQTLSSIPKAHAAQAQRILLWLAIMERPLYIDEVVEVAILESENPLEPEERLSPRYYVGKTCSKLVAVYMTPGDENGR